MLSYFLSKRFTKSSGTARTYTTGCIIAVLGVAFAVAIMEITVSVTMGFKQQITEKLTGFVAPVTITSPLLYDDQEREVGATFYATDIIYNAVRECASGAKTVNIYTLPAILKSQNDFVAVAVKGYETENYDAQFEKSNIKHGSWLDEKARNQIVISQNTAERLDLNVDDKINLCFFIDGKVKTRVFHVKGIYNSGFSEYDNAIAYTAIDDLRKIDGKDKNMVTAVEIRNIDRNDAERIADSLRQRFINEAILHSDPHYDYNVETINSRGAIYLNWLELLDTNVIVIFVLMSLVAISTLISSLFIQVLEKIPAIGLLRALGATNVTVGNIFVYLSLRLAGLGIIFGNIIGLGFVLIQSHFNALTLNPDMYYLDHVPVSIDITSYLLINIGVALVAWFILILPSRMAVRLSPASTLRYD